MDTVITVDPILWSLLIGSIIPIIVAVATKLQASGGLKAILGIVLGVVGAAVVTLNQTAPDGSFSWKLLAFTAATAIITTVTTYVGAWKPVLAINEQTAPNFGLGGGSSV